MQLAIDGPRIGISVGRAVALLEPALAGAPVLASDTLPATVRALLVDAVTAGGSRVALACDDKHIVTLAVGAGSGAFSRTGDAVQPKKPTGLVRIALPARAGAAAPEHALVAVDRSGEATALPDPDVGARRRALLAHTASIVTAVVVVDGAPGGASEFLLTGDRDGKIRVSHLPHAWDIEAYCLGHTKFVTALALLPPVGDGRDALLASAGGDATVRLWAWRTGALLHTLYLSSGGGAVPSEGPHADGRMNAASGDADGEAAAGSHGDGGEGGDGAAAAKGTGAAGGGAPPLMPRAFVRRTDPVAIRVAAATAAAAAPDGAASAVAAAATTTPSDADAGGGDARPSADDDGCGRGGAGFPAALAVHGPSGLVATFLEGETLVRLLRVEQGAGDAAGARLAQVAVFSTPAPPLALAFAPSTSGVGAEGGDAAVLLVGCATPGGGTDGGPSFAVLAWRVRGGGGGGGGAGGAEVATAPLAAADAGPVAAALNAALRLPAFAAGAAFPGGGVAAARGHLIAERMSDFDAGGGGGGGEVAE